jgi:hypothetical protein
VELTATSAAAQAQELTQNTIAVSMLRKTLDLSAEQGAELVKMMDQAGGLGQRVDLHG